MKLLKFFVAIIATAFLITACGGGGGSTGTGGGGTVNPPPPTYTVGGSTDSLTPLNGVLILQNNAGSDLTLTGNGAGSVIFTFPTSLANGAAYDVTVKSQPDGQICTISNGIGKVPNANVTSVSLSCVSAYKIGGSVTGLNKGNSLVLQNSGGDDLTVAYIADNTSVPFAFATKVATGSAYAVSVKTQPLGLSCSVTKGNGTIATSDVTVDVTCVHAPVAMPTLADYNTAASVDGACYAYLMEQTKQTGSNSNTEDKTVVTTHLCVKENGNVNFLGETYPTITSYFNDERTWYSHQPCSIFPLYVGKSGTCTRSYQKKDIFGSLVGPVGNDTQTWSVDSVVDTTVIGKKYKAFKIVYSINNSIEGEYTWERIYVPDLKLFVLSKSRKNDGTFYQEVLLTSLP